MRYIPFQYEHAIAMHPIITGNHFSNTVATLKFCKYKSIKVTILRNYLCNRMHNIYVIYIIHAWHTTYCYVIHTISLI